MRPETWYEGRTSLDLLRGPDVTVTSVEAGLIEVTGTTSEVIGEAAASAGIVLHELTPLRGSLEDAYMQLTADDVEYHSAPVVPAPAGAPTEGNHR